MKIIIAGLFLVHAESSADDAGWAALLGSPAFK